MKTEYSIHKIKCSNCNQLFQIGTYKSYSKELKCPYCKTIVSAEDKDKLTISKSNKKKYFIRLRKFIIGLIISSFVWYFIKLGIKWFDKYLGP